MPARRATAGRGSQPESRRGGLPSSRTSMKRQHGERGPGLLGAFEGSRLGRTAPAPRSPLPTGPWRDPRGSPRSCRRLQSRFRQDACSVRVLGSGRKAPCQGVLSALLQTEVCGHTPRLSSLEVRTADPRCGSGRRPAPQRGVAALFPGAEAFLFATFGGGVAFGGGGGRGASPSTSNEQSSKYTLPGAGASYVNQAHTS